MHTRAERKMLPYRQPARGAAARSASLESGQGTIFLGNTVRIIIIPAGYGRPVSIMSKKGRAAGHKAGNQSDCHHHDHEIPFLCQNIPDIHLLTLPVSISSPQRSADIFCINILRCPGRSQFFYGTFLYHFSQHSFNGCRADIRKKLTDFGFRNR